MGANKGRACSVSPFRGAARSIAMATLRVGFVAIALCLAPLPRASAQGASSQDRAAELQSQRERIQALMEARRQEIERRREQQKAQQEGGEDDDEAEAEEDESPPETPPPSDPQADGDTPPALAVASSTYLTIQPGRSNVEPGDRFDTHVQALNVTYVPLDDIELYLKYPPDVLRLVAVSDARIRPRLAGQPVYEQSATSGSLYYRASVAPAHHFNNELLLTLRWEALLPAMSVPIRFVQSAEPDERTTALRLKDKDRLGQEDNPLDGALRAEVSISEPQRYGGRPLQDIPATTRQGGMRLRMATEPGPVAVGDVTTMTVYLENPGGMMLDTVRLRMWFDPKILEVVDWDHRNWIKIGTNVQDGFARETFPFSFHSVNNADNHFGQIDYKMALSGRFIPPSDAPIIKVLFRALAPTRDNLVCFDITPDRRRTSPQTALFFEGRNALDYGAMLVDYSIFHPIPVVEGQAAPDEDQ